MAWLKYAWAISVRIVIILVVLALFASTYDKTQLLILAIGGIIFATVRSGFVWSSLQRAEIAVALHTRISDLKQKAGLGDDKEEIASALEYFSKFKAMLYIEGVHQAAIYMICVFNLLFGR